MKYKVLFVDDEEKILFSLKRLFRNSDFETYYATSGQEGLELLRKKQVSVIVSDMKMPGMNGVEFLIEAMEIAPDAVRIILSGYAESGRIMDAVNNGHIWRFIPKPWNNDEIKISIINAIDLYKREKERKELTESLKQKTVELDILNKHLEEKVQERTWQLNERTTLLNLMLEDEDIEIIIKQSCKAVSRLLGGCTVYIKSMFHDELFCSGDQADGNISDRINNLVKKSLDSEVVISDGTNLAVPLRRTDSRLGSLIVEKSTDNNIEERVAGFTSLLNMALNQYKSFESAPELLENIDKIIGSI